MIRVQREDFDVGAEMAAMSGKNVGALASFVGLVRGSDGDGAIGAMTLEHYPGMTEKKLAEIEVEARQRWPLEDCLVVHRYGRLEPGERIVLVVTAASHRKAALEACAFLIDWLKPARRSGSSRSVTPAANGSRHAPRTTRRRNNGRRLKNNMQPRGPRRLNNSGKRAKARAADAAARRLRKHQKRRVRAYAR